MADNDVKEKNEEEVLNINDTSVSKESMFHHKLRKRDKKIKNSESYKNNAIIYVVSMVALFVIWFTAFAQPLAYNNRLLLFNNNDKGDNYNPDNGKSNNDSNNSNNGQSNNNSGNSNNNRYNNRGTKNFPSYNVTPSDSQRWNVGFVNMTLSERIGFAREVNAPSYTSTRANFHVSLVELGDEISYNIDIKNSGTIDAKVADITIYPITDIDDQISFVFSGLEVGDELDAGDTTTVSVNIKYNPQYTGSEENTSQDFLVLISYVQK